MQVPGDACMHVCFCPPVGRETGPWRCMHVYSLVRRLANVRRSPPVMGGNAAPSGIPPRRPCHMHDACPVALTSSCPKARPAPPGCLPKSQKRPACSKRRSLAPGPRGMTKRRIRRARRAALMMRRARSSPRGPERRHYLRGCWLVKPRMQDASSRCSTG